MLDRLIFLDIQITNFIYNIIPHFTPFDYFFTLLTQIGSPLFLWIVVISLIFIQQRKNVKLFLYSFLGSYFISGVLVNIILKNIFGRIRPEVYIENSVFQCPLDHSFPSGHATAAFSAAVILASYDQKRASIYYLFATLISYSRVYLQCHYFIDIFGGAIIGATISVAALYYVKKSKIWK